MAGRKVPAELRLASNYLLWRLNQLGRLALVDEELEPINAAAAKAAIAEDLDARGAVRYPKGSEPWPARRWPIGAEPELEDE